MNVQCKIGLAAIAVISAILIFGTLLRAAPKSDIGKTALIIIDIQNDYFPGGKLEMFEAVKAGENAQKLLAFYRKKGAPVIHIRHENQGEKATFFIPNTPGAEIHPLVAPKTGEKILLKHKPSSFIGTTLEEDLRGKKITHLVIVGMQSNVCVRATTLEALKKDFTVTVATDAIAAKNTELHDKAIAEMKEKNAKMTTVDSLMKK